MNSSFPSIQRLKPEDIAQFRQLNCLFANCFDDHQNYQSSPPSDDYLAKLLEKENVIPLVALADEYVVGGLVAYELDKFEQERREIYIYSES